MDPLLRSLAECAHLRYRWAPAIRGPVSKDISRRTFAQLSATAGGLAVIGFDPTIRSWLLGPAGQDRPLRDLPRLDGALLLDEATRSAIAVDRGRLFRRIPRAVLQPRSVHDIVSIVKYANQHGLKIATKGDGHSCYGQTQAEAGIVIDSRTLNSVNFLGTSSIDIGPGAFWSAVALMTIGRGLTPRVFPATCMALTVGGVLSAGGIGMTSHRHGAIIDNVVELDVVTGDGTLITCSSSRHPELFNMVLGGQGQCGIIVRARFPLITAPTHVVVQTLVYSTLDAFLAAQQRMSSEALFDTQRGSIDRAHGAAWTYSIEVGRFMSQDDASTPQLQTPDLGFQRASAPVRMTYSAFLFRHEERNAAYAASGRPSPQLVMWMPASESKHFLTDEILSLSPTESGLLRADGTETFGVYPLVPRRLTRPLFKIPLESRAFAIWFFRSVRADDPAALSSMLESNRRLLARVTALGGKRYAPYSMVMTPDEWAVHFGPDVWKRLSAAKRSYDPKGVLSPEPAMFGAATH